jgi:hypothetical protein
MTGVVDSHMRRPALCIRPVLGLKTSPDVYDIGYQKWLDTIRLAFRLIQFLTT